MAICLPRTYSMEYKEAGPEACRSLKVIVQDSFLTLFLYNVCLIYDMNYVVYRFLYFLGMVVITTVVCV